MKKLFTLFAAAVCALTASAKENLPGFTPGTLTFTSWTWNTLASLGGGEVVQVGEQDAPGSADDSGVTYFDASDHDYVIIKYSAATVGQVKGIVQYNCTGVWGQWGANFNNEETAHIANPTGGMIAIKLNIDRSDKVYTLAIQDLGSAGTMDVTEAYFATEEEYKAEQEEADKKEKIFILDEESTHSFKAGEGWGWDSKWFGDTDIKAFNTLVVKVKSVTGKGQFTFTNDCKVTLEATEAPVVYTVDISAIESFEQIAYQNINVLTEGADGPDGDTEIVMEKAYLTSKTKAEVDEDIATGISNTIAVPVNDNAPMYNLAGQKVDNSYKGVVIKNGKKFFNK